jgi:hypothetical protein
MKMTIAFIVAAFLSGVLLGAMAVKFFTAHSSNVVPAKIYHATNSYQGSTNYQLRIYRIRPGQMAQWVSEWRRDVYQPREKFGFKIIGPWVIEPSNQFIWILGYEGPEGFKARDAAYYTSLRGSPATVPNPARLIAQRDIWYMTSVNR